MSIGKEYTGRAVPVQWAQSHWRRHRQIQIWSPVPQNRLRAVCGHAVTRWRDAKQRTGIFHSEQKCWHWKDIEPGSSSEEASDPKCSLCCETMGTVTATFLPGGRLFRQGDIQGGQREGNLGTKPGAVSAAIWDGQRSPPMSCHWTKPQLWGEFAVFLEHLCSVPLTCWLEGRRGKGAPEMVSGLGALAAKSPGQGLLAGPQPRKWSFSTWAMTGFRRQVGAVHERSEKQCNALTLAA